MNYSPVERALLCLLFKILIIIPSVAIAITPQVVREPGELISETHETNTAVGDCPQGIFGCEGGRTVIGGVIGNYLFLAGEGPGSAPNSVMGRWVWDISNPASPQLVQFFQGQEGGVNAHAYIKVGATMVPPMTLLQNGTISEYETGIWNHLLGWNRGAMFAGWDAEFKWIYGTVAGSHYLRGKGSYQEAVNLQYGAPQVPNGIQVYWDQKTFSRIPIIQETGVIGHPFILGNLLIYASDQSDTGIAAYDISDPENPILLDALNTERGFGGYWAEVWHHFIIMPRRRAVSNPPDPEYTGSVNIVDFSDPTELRLVQELPVKGNPMYIQFQDNFGFAERSKINLEPLLTGGQAAVVLELDEEGTGIDTSQLQVPIGNLLVTGGYPSDGLSQGAAIWAHQADPDTLGPSVAYSFPTEGEQFASTMTPISVLIHEEIHTDRIVPGTTLVFRRIGTEDNIPFRHSYSMSDVLTVDPIEPLEAGTDYELLIADDTIYDAVGNPLVDTTGDEDNWAYRLTFRTDSGLNPRPNINSFTMNPSSPVTTGTTVQFQVQATDNDELEYRIDFGSITNGERDRTDWGAITTFNHQYATTGTYKVTVQAREVGTTTRLTSSVVWLVVHDPVPPSLPQNSSTITVDSTNRIVWSVSPDNNRVIRINADSNSLLGTTATCQHPSSIALDSGRNAWVTCRDGDQLEIFSPNGSSLALRSLPYGSRPVNITFAPNGQNGFIALEGKNQIARVTAQSRDITGFLPNRTGVNFEVFSILQGDDFFAQSIADVDNLLSTGANLRRFNGIWTGALTEDLVQHFDYRWPTALLNELMGLYTPYTIIYRGNIEIDTAGTYTFSLRAGRDSGGRLIVRDQTVILNEQDGSTPDEGVIESGTISLPAGLQPFELSYYGNVYPQVLELRYSGPGVVDQVVPAGKLYPQVETRKPAGLAATANHLYVTQLISDDNAGKVSVANLTNNSWLPDIYLYLDEKKADSGAEGNGLPNYVRSIVLNHAGTKGWFSSQKTNFLGGTNRRSNTVTSTLTFESGVRAVLGTIDTANRIEPNVGQDRVDLDNLNLPSGMAIDPYGTRVIVAMQANNEIQVFDGNTLKRLDRAPVGLAPDGIAVDSITKKIFVSNLTDRTVTVINGQEFFDSGTPGLADNIMTTISTISPTQELLDPDVLRGKQLFYTAAEFEEGLVEDNPQARMANDGYMSCASCHIDGDHDGRTWDLTQFGEGLRNTIPLRGRRGTGHGMLHWSANFDEVQDFEGQIRSFAGGTGFINGVVHAPLGTNNAGRDTDLDALAAYLESLGRETLPKSPYRNADGTMTEAAIVGATVFSSLGCDNCHRLDNEYTDSIINPQSPILHDVASIRNGSGQRLNSTLSGFDTPTLLGLHATAPYLHDGGASVLSDVFRYFDSNAPSNSSRRAHDLRSVSFQERQQLLQYLLQLDGTDNEGEITDSEQSPTPTPTPEPTPTPTPSPSPTPQPSPTQTPVESILSEVRDLLEGEFENKREWKQAAKTSISKLRTVLKSTNKKGKKIIKRLIKRLNLLLNKLPKQKVLNKVINQLEKVRSNIVDNGD